MTGYPKLRLSRLTKDIDLLLPFYRDGLGFEVLDRSENVDGMDTVLLGHKDWPYQFEFSQIRGAEAAPRASSPEHYRVFCIEEDGDVPSRCSSGDAACAVRQRQVAVRGLRRCGRLPRGSCPR